jgi:hypothetical protein
LVEAVFFKQEGRGDDVIGFFQFTFQPHYALGFTQPLPEMSTRILPGSKTQPVRKADNLIAICMSVV